MFQRLLLITPWCREELTFQPFEKSTPLEGRNVQFLGLQNKRQLGYVCAQMHQTKIMLRLTQQFDPLQPVTLLLSWDFEHTPASAWFHIDSWPYQIKST